MPPGLQPEDQGLLYRPLRRSKPKFCSESKLRSKVLNCISESILKSLIWLERHPVAPGLLKDHKDYLYRPLRTSNPNRSPPIRNNVFKYPSFSTIGLSIHNRLYQNIIKFVVLEVLRFPSEKLSIVHVCNDYLSKWNKNQWLLKFEIAKVFLCQIVSVVETLEVTT